MTSKCKHIKVCARCSQIGHKYNTCTKAFKCVNCEENHTSYNKKCNVYKREYEIQNIKVSGNNFFEARKVYQQTHGQWLMNYAGAIRAPIQSASVCTQTDVSWVGAQPVTRKKRTAAPVTSGPVPSVSRSVGTTTRVADVKKTVAPAKSSPPKKGEQSSKPASPKQQVQPVHESDAYSTVKHARGKVKRVPLSPVYTSPPLSSKILF